MPGELICHGDFGPWNLVWRDGMPVGLIDFDDARRGDASEDVARALELRVATGYYEIGEALRDFIEGQLGRKIGQQLSLL